MLDVEAYRAARRMGIEPHALVEALETLTLVVPAETTFPTARKVGPDLEEVVTYDRRLAAGCEEANVPVHTPGLPPGWWRD